MDGDHREIQLTSLCPQTFVVRRESGSGGILCPMPTAKGSDSAPGEDDPGPEASATEDGRDEYHGQRLKNVRTKTKTVKSLINTFVYKGLCRLVSFLTYLNLCPSFTLRSCQLVSEAARPCPVLVPPTSSTTSHVGTPAPPRGRQDSAQRGVRDVFTNIGLSPPETTQIRLQQNLVVPNTSMSKRTLSSLSGGATPPSSHPPPRTHICLEHTFSVLHRGLFHQHKRPTHPRARRPENIPRRSVCRTLGAAQGHRGAGSRGRGDAPVHDSGGGEFARQLEEDRRKAEAAQCRAQDEKFARLLEEDRRKAQEAHRRAMEQGERKGAALGRSRWRESIENASAVNARTRPSARLCGRILLSDFASTRKSGLPGMAAA